MMILSKQKTLTLLNLIASSKPDGLDCGGCFEQLAEFVESELAGHAIPAALSKVQRHLEQCACCYDEHNALVESLQALKTDHAFPVTAEPLVTRLR